MPIRIELWLLQGTSLSSSRSWQTYSKLLSGLLLVLRAFVLDNRVASSHPAVAPERAPYIQTGLLHKGTPSPSSSLSAFPEEHLSVHHNLVIPALSQLFQSRSVVSWCRALVSPACSQAARVRAYMLQTGASSACNVAPEVPLLPVALSPLLPTTVPQFFT